MCASPVRSKRTWTRWVFYVLLAFGCLLIGYEWMAARLEVKRANAAVAPTVYDADAGSSYMPDVLLTGMILLTPEQMLNTPLIDGFSSPLGGEKGAMTYDAQPFGTWNETYDGYHQGQDLNGIGGMDTDRGEPVYAVARGLVVYSGTPSQDWGNVIVLAHRLPEGRLVQTLYAHLESSRVTPGRMVGRGEQIGTVGTAGPTDNPYPAHLHFEAAESLVIEAGMPGYSKTKTNRINPEELMKQYPAPLNGALPDTMITLRRLLFQNNTEVQTSSPSTLPDGAVIVNPSQMIKKTDN